METGFECSAIAIACTILYERGDNVSLGSSRPGRRSLETSLRIGNKWTKRDWVAQIHLDDGMNYESQFTVIVLIPLPPPTPLLCLAQTPILWVNFSEMALKSPLIRRPLYPGKSLVPFADRRKLSSHLIEQSRY